MYFFRLFLLAILYISLISQTKAQTYLELRGGYVGNQLNQSFDSGTFEKVEASGGAYVGIIATCHITERFFIKFGSEWVEKKYILRRAAPFDAIYKRTNSQYLQLPVSTGLILISFKKLQLAASAGLYGGYWMSSKLNGTIPNAFDTFNTQDNGNVTANFRVTNYEVKSDLGNSDYTRLDLGGVFELNTTYAIHDSWLLTGNLEYQHGLTSQQKSSRVSNPFQANRTMVLSIGIMHKFQ